VQGGHLLRQLVADLFQLLLLTHHGLVAVSDPELPRSTLKP
jgi:hypothetical protein